MNPITRQALQEIAQRHGFTLEQLQSRAHRKSGMAARRECYQWLRTRRWSYEQIGRVFNRKYSSVLQTIQPDAIREQRLARYRNYMAARAA